MPLHRTLRIACLVALTVAAACASPTTAVAPPKPIARAAKAPAARRSAILESVTRERLARLDEKRRRADMIDLTISADERWILQDIQGGGARVWEWGADGLKLAWRLELDGLWRLGPDGRILGRETRQGGDLFVIDARSGSTQRFADVGAYDVVSGNLLLANKRSVRRVDWTTLALRETATASVDLELQESGGFQMLAGGRSVAAGDTLVSLDKGTALVQGLRFLTPSSDQQRILACSNDNAIVLDTSTGRTIAQFRADPAAICGFTLPALSPDGRFVVGLEVATTSQGRTMIVAVFDTTNGKTTRKPFKSMSYSTALDAGVSIENSIPPRVCVHYGNMHWRRDLCPWVLDNKGRVAPAPAMRGDRASSIHSSGAELGRATSPDGKVVAIATYDERPRKGDAPPEYRNLMLWIIEVETKRVVRNFNVVPGAVTLILWSSDGMTPPSLRFVSPTQVLLNRGVSGIPSGVFDTISGAFVQVDDNAEWLGSRFARVGNTLVDLTTNRSYSLVPDAAAWKNARQFSASVPADSARTPP